MLCHCLQAEVDDDPRPGRWILTGSEDLGLPGSVAQTLAGRTGILHLLPLAIDELRRFPKPPTDLFSTLVAGGFPRIHDRHIPSNRWLGDYVQTYLQRDVRRLAISDLEAFTTFMQLLAGPHRPGRARPTSTRRSWPTRRAGDRGERSGLNVRSSIRRIHHPDT